MRFEILQVGDRVRLSSRAVLMGLNGRLDRREGVVVGYCRPPYDGCVRVKRDREKQASGWAPWLWTRVEDGATGAAVDRAPAVARPADRKIAG